MALVFEELDRTTRRHMRSEFYQDLTAGTVHLPDRLNASGRVMFAVALETTIERGDVSTLSENLRENGFVREWEDDTTANGRTISKHVPWDAADRIAEDTFNNYYMRGICRRAVDEHQQFVEVYSTQEDTLPTPAIVYAHDLLVQLRSTQMKLDPPKYRALRILRETKTSEK